MLFNFMESPFWTQPFNPPLPTVMADELSYYEFVKKIFYHYKGLQDAVKQAFTEAGNLILANEQAIRELEVRFAGHQDTLLKISREYTDSLFNRAIAGQVEMDVRLNRKIDSNFKALSTQMTANYNYTLSIITENYRKLEGLIQNVDAKLAPLKQELKAYTDAQLIPLHDEIKKHKAEVDAEISLLYTDIDRIALEIDKFYARFIVFQTDVRKEVKEELEKAVEELKHQCAQLNGNAILVTSPVTGKLTSLYTTLVEIYSGLWWARITATEYDSMKLTAAAYDSRKIKALDYDTHARFIFFRELYMMPYIEKFEQWNQDYILGMQELNRKLTMRNPITGRVTSMQEVIYNILDKLHNEWKLTAQQYDLLNLQAAAYDALRMTAFEYDFFAKKHISL